MLMMLIRHAFRCRAAYAFDTLIDYADIAAAMPCHVALLIADTPDHLMLRYAADDATLMMPLR